MNIILAFAELFAGLVQQHGIVCLPLSLHAGRTSNISISSLSSFTSFYVDECDGNV